MPTKSAETNENDDLRPEYDLSTLTGGVRGKYYGRATAGTTLVLLERDVAEAFPDGETINQALRVLIRIAETKARTTKSQLEPTKHRAAAAEPRAKGSTQVAKTCPCGSQVNANDSSRQSTFGSGPDEWAVAVEREERGVKRTCV